MSRRDDRVMEIISHEAAAFIALEASKESLITVTRAVPRSRGERVTVFITVFPEEKIRPALVFLERHRQAFSDHLKKHVQIGRLPKIDFMLDDGEKNRQRLDELTGGPGGN